MNIELLHKIRRYELERVISLIPNGASILEIGGGAGWQAKLLSEHGFSVEAIDISESQYIEHQVWPVKIYDGETIPFEDAAFDVVFSSNVLEHIVHVKEFQEEIKRVLKSGSFAIHLMPTGSWRFWTNVAFYLTLPKNIWKLVNNRLLKRNITAETEAQPTTNTARGYVHRSILRKIVRLMTPYGHGQTGNSLSQIYLFSRFRWKKLFDKTGWSVCQCSSNKLFYTGFLLLGGWLSLNIRHILSYILGGSCYIYVLRKNDSI